MDKDMMCRVAIRDIGFMTEVIEAVALAKVIVPAMERAMHACKNASSSSFETGNRGDDLYRQKAIEEHDAYLAFKSMVNRINDLGKYA